MSREITTHKHNDCNDAIMVAAIDEPGSGGANHQYKIEWQHLNGNGIGGICFTFQNGPVKEVGNNGVTQQALLAILIDRLECFQDGPYACDENARTLAALNDAMACSKERTLKRLARGVEGTHEV